VVTGAGAGGIGAHVAVAFATAGARKIALIGRTEKTLRETKDTITKAYPDADVLVAVTDTSKSESLGLAAHRIRSDLGAWDVYADFAAILAEPVTIAASDEDTWWQAFEINVISKKHFAKHFLPKCRPNATYIACNAASALIPGSWMPKVSSYNASKVAAAKLDEYLAAENPNLRVFTMHPGVVETRMTETVRSSGVDLPPEAIDKPELPSHFSVWLASPEAEFLRSRFIWCNWDVEEMLARKEEISANPVLLTMTLGGWPFS
jgi:NAD(P)-dependent dehydrogenase (short-subunit alcohol dehydrogenase family)